MSNKSPRDALRSKLLGSAPKPRAELVKLFGVEVEVRQPTLASILESQDTDDIKKRTVDMIIKYAYVPGTDERVFDVTDADVILGWPFSDDLLNFQTMIGKMSGVDFEGAEVELKTDPLEE